MVRHVVEVCEELGLHHHAGCPLVLPTPEARGVGRELGFPERALQPGGVHGTALDLQVHLYIDVGSPDVAVRGAGAEEIGNQSSEEHELGDVPVGIYHAHERPLCEVTCLPATYWVRHRAPPADDEPPLPSVRLRQSGRRTRGRAEPPGSR